MMPLDTRSLTLTFIVCSQYQQHECHWETFGNAESENPTQTHWIRIYILTSSLRGFMCSVTCETHEFREMLSRFQVSMERHVTSCTWETSVFRTACIPSFSHILTPHTATTNGNYLTAPLCHGPSLGTDVFPENFARGEDSRWFEAYC